MNDSRDFKAELDSAYSRTQLIHARSRLSFPLPPKPTPLIPPRIPYPKEENIKSTHALNVNLLSIRPSRPSFQSHAPIRLHLFPSSPFSIHLKSHPLLWPHTPSKKHDPKKKPRQSFVFSVSPVCIYHLKPSTFPLFFFVILLLSFFFLSNFSSNFFRKGISVALIPTSRDSLQGSGIDHAGEGFWIMGGKMKKSEGKRSYARLSEVMKYIAFSLSLLSLSLPLNKPPSPPTKIKIKIKNIPHTTYIYIKKTSNYLYHPPPFFFSLFFEEWEKGERKKRIIKIN